MSISIEISCSTYDLKPLLYDLKPLLYDLKPLLYDLKPLLYDFCRTTTRIALPTTQHIKESANAT